MKILIVDGNVVLKTALRIVPNESKVEVDDYVIQNLNSGNCQVFDISNVPDDFVSRKYLYIDGEFQPNPAYVPPAQPDAGKQLSQIDFLARFSDEELAILYTAAKTNVAIEIMMDKFRVAQFIDTADPRTRSGVQALETGGIIGPGRAAEILA